MRSIGIVSEEAAEQILEMIKGSQGMKDFSIKIYSIPCECVEDLDMLIINSHREGLSEFLKRFKNKSTLALINSDDKRLNAEMSSFKGRVISYGFNQKACVTASSIDEGEFTTVQCCIQRSLPTFSGGVLEEQEFSVSPPITGASPNVILAWAAAAAISI